MKETPNIYRAKSRQKRKNPIKKIIITVIIIFVVIGISIGGIFGYGVLNDAYGYKNYNVTTDITIPKGANTTDISNLLLEAKVIKYPKLFRIFSKKLDADTSYKPGVHTLDKIAGYENIINELIKPGKDLMQLLIPEGFTQNDIADTLSKMNFGTKDDIIKEINSIDITKYDFLKDMPKSADRAFILEGYIFPDTYTEIFPTDTVTSIINRALKNTEKQLKNNNIEQLAKDHSMTIDEAIILASVIQREVSDTKNMKQVSAVFHNRLGIKMKLQSDVTVSYALDGKKAITVADTKTQSPYNTYYTDALPIGPICNPGIDAILAALTPNSEYLNANYLYFYSRPNGEVFYSKTHDEHLKIIKQYSSEWKDINQKNSK